MNLIFLHGALGCKKHWNSIIELLDIDAKIHNLDFPSHGDNVDIIKEYTIDSLANYVDNYIQTNKLTDCIIIGYSLGGYVALYLAQTYLKELIILATKLDWEGPIIQNECEKLTIQNFQPILSKLQSEQNLEIELLIKISKEIIFSIHNFKLNEELLNEINCKITALIGDKDKMIHIDEMEFLVNNTPSSKVKILEGKPHLLHKMDAQYLSFKLNHLFFKRN